MNNNGDRNPVPPDDWRAVAPQPVEDRTGHYQPEKTFDYIVGLNYKPGSRN